ncbi:MAG TPA: hypothetical protein VK891_11050 [Euzebyales bacterium]|nr:hypothetical protein [Euzebyales bacterium]
MRDLPAVENRRHWDAMADRWVAVGERSWAYREIRAPEPADDGSNFGVTGAWAKRWPAEHAFWLTAR